jgi:hypothetical protein
MSIVMMTAVSHSVAARQATATAAAAKPLIEEWVYRTRYGFTVEWWAIFRKYQIAILERRKQLGYVKDFTVYAPRLHTQEESRWDYRVIIIRASADAPRGNLNVKLQNSLFLSRLLLNAKRTGAGNRLRTIGICPFTWSTSALQHSHSRVEQGATI